MVHVTLQLLGQGLGFSMKLNNPVSQVTDAGMTAVMDYLQCFTAPLRISQVRESRVAGLWQIQGPLKKVTLFNVNLHARFDLSRINARMLMAASFLKLVKGAISAIIGRSVTC